jgi:hypothetical protein
VIDWDQDKEGQDKKRGRGGIGRKGEIGRQGGIGQGVIGRQGGLGRQGAHQSSDKRVFLLLLLFDLSLRLHSALRPAGVEIHCVLEDGQDLRGE